MKVSKPDSIIIFITMAAIAFAGCSGTSTATPAPGGATVDSGAKSLFSNLPYEWAEYKNHRPVRYATGNHVLQV